MKHLAFVAVALCSLLLFDERCASEPAGVQPKPAQVQSVAEICQDAARYADRVVTLKGVFLGFRVAECRFSEAASSTGQTRRDWLFRTGDDCLYVTGGAPGGVDPIDPAFVGRRVELTTRVSRTDAGKLYLKYIEGRLLDNWPLVATPAQPRSAYCQPRILVSWGG